LEDGPGRRAREEQDHRPPPPSNTTERLPSPSTAGRAGRRGVSAGRSRAGLPCTDGSDRSARGPTDSLRRPPAARERRAVEGGPAVGAGEGRRRAGGCGVRPARRGRGHERPRAVCAVTRILFGGSRRQNEPLHAAVPAEEMSVHAQSVLPAHASDDRRPPYRRRADSVPLRCPAPAPAARDLVSRERSLSPSGAAIRSVTA
jgi:hypothetical protein